MGEPTVNGDMPHSQTLEHVSKYPVISDSINAFSSNPYGQKSIDITNKAYATFVKPTFPYLQTPASYAKPYVAKADEIGNTILTKVDEKVPILKSETSEIKSTVIDYAHWPVKVANDQKDYVFKTYNNEYKKCGGDGVVAGSKALVSGSFVITSDWFSYFASLLQKSQKKMQEKAGEAKKTVNAKAGEAQKTADAKAGEAQEKIQEKTDN